MVTDLIRSRGQHRLTWRDRTIAQIRRSQFVVIVAFWGVVVAVAGFVAGWVWAQAVAL